MKKVIMGSLLGLLFVSCSRDNEKDVVEEKVSIVGTWKPVKETRKRVSSAYNHKCVSKTDYMTFSSNGIGVSVIYNKDCVGSPMDFSYRIDGDKLINDYFDGDLVIKELSSKRLIIEQSFDFDNVGKSDNYILEFTRQ